MIRRLALKQREADKGPETGNKTIVFVSHSRPLYDRD